VCEAFIVARMQGSSDTDIFEYYELSPGGVRASARFTK